MKKEKLSAVIIFTVIIFVVFALGLFVGKRLSPKKSKEGVINESALKNSGQPSLSSLNPSDNKKTGGSLPVSPNDIKFAPISKLASLKNGSSSKETAGKSTKPVVLKRVPLSAKANVRTKIVYVKKPVYIYKYVTKNSSAKAKTQTSPINSNIYYTIQVAALSKYSDAKKLADKFTSMGFFAYIVPITVSEKNGKAVYEQVRVGKFATIGGAKSVEKTISNKFHLKPYIIKAD